MFLTGWRRLRRICSGLSIPLDLLSGPCTIVTSMGRRIGIKMGHAEIAQTRDRAGVVAGHWFAVGPGPRSRRRSRSRGAAIRHAGSGDVENGCKGEVPKQRARLKFEGSAGGDWGGAALEESAAGRARLLPPGACDLSASGVSVRVRAFG